MAILKAPATDWSLSHSQPAALANRIGTPVVAPSKVKVLCAPNPMGMRPVESASGVIMGASQILGVNTVAPWLLLQDKTGVPFAITMASGGLYTFAGLAPGEYAAVMLDPSGGYRGKVAHTVVI